MGFNSQHPQQDLPQVLVLQSEQVSGDESLQTHCTDQNFYELLTSFRNVLARHDSKAILAIWEGNVEIQNYCLKGKTPEGTLMTIVSIAFCWAHKIGEWRTDIKAIRLKIYRNNRRYQESTYFCYGFNWIREIVLSFTSKISAFIKCLALLSCNASNNLIIKEKI